MLGPGDVLGNRYRLEEFVASGGMGQVFRATDQTLGRTVAVKVLLPGLTSDAEFGSRFRAEARIMASIGHPGVVGVYDYGESPEGTMYLVMAFVDGRPLGERIIRDGGLPVADTLAVVAQAADALQAAHANGIIHRDVKPNNLLLNDHGGVTLVDFGVARSSSVTSVTKVNAVIGTALYMSPEQASGKPIGPATDIYALGAVAYHCLTGVPPFTGNSPLEIAIKHLQDEPMPLSTEFPPSVRALVERAMAKDPQVRFPTAAAFAEAARAAAQDKTLPELAGVPVVPPRPLEPAPQAGRPAWVPLLIGLALLALAGGVVLTVIALTRSANSEHRTDSNPAASTSPTVAVTTHAPTGGGVTRTTSAPSIAVTTGAPATATAAPTTAPPATTAAPATSNPVPPPTTTQGPTPPTVSVEASTGG